MKRFIIVNIIMCFCMICPLSAQAEVEWQVQHTIKLERTPVDTVMSDSGAYIFVLTDDGIVQVYDKAGDLRGQIDAGMNVDGIACGPKENILLLSSKKDKKIHTIFVDFIQDINIEGSPFKGNADAPVVIVEFSDYQCSHCSRMTSKLKEVIKENKNAVKVVFKNFPLSMHKYARDAAAAALVADSMGKFWEFHEALFENYNKLNTEKIREIATGLGLDADEFFRKMKSQKIQNKIDQDIRDGEKAMVKGTPTIFINGKQLRDGSIEGFQDLINKQLKKKK